MAGNIEKTGITYSEPTGNLPFKYFREKRYIMAIYEYNRNAILIEAIKIAKDDQLPTHMKIYTISYQPKA